MKRHVVLFFFLPVLCLISSGCATNRLKTLALMGAGGLVLGTASACLTPSDQLPAMNALLGAALGASGGAVIGLYAFDEEKRASELERQNNVLKLELRSFREEGEPGGGFASSLDSSANPELLYSSRETLERELPPEYGHLVKPGKWSVYRLDTWVTEGDGTMIHQDKLLRLTPAVLSPQISVTDENLGRLKRLPPASAPRAVSGAPSLLTRAGTQASDFESDIPVSPAQAAEGDTKKLPPKAEGEPEATRGLEDHEGPKGRPRIGGDRDTSPERQARAEAF